MVTHEDICIKAVFILVFVSGKYRKILPVVFFIPENLLSLVATGYDMIKGTFKLYSRLSRHEERLSQQTTNVNNQV